MVLDLSSAFLIMSRPPLPKSLFTKMIASVFSFAVSLMYRATLGMAVACVKLVRKMYGLPCMVILAASPPVKLGISALRLSAMLTMMEPENTGPKMANTLSSTAFCVRPLATPGLLCVSDVVAWIFLPKMPPDALISFTASSTPFLKLVPAVAPPPESSTMLAILIVSCAKAVPTLTAPSANVQAAINFRLYCFCIVCLLGLLS